MVNRPTQLRGALLAALVAVAWIVLALRRPMLTYHFAPLIGGVVWPLSLRSQGQASTQDGRVGAAGALGLMLAVTVGLVAVGAMEGPNFLHQGPAWPEAALFSVLGAAIGMRAATRERPGLLGSVVDASS